jgi:xanthine dehydrogenase accessory factor
VIRADLLQRASELRARRMPFVAATVVRVQRPASARPGDAALLLPDGTVEGFVGGACTEATVRVQGLRQLAAGQSALLRITPAAADAAGGPDAGAAPEGIVTAPNPCLSGGTVDIFLEVVRPAMLVHVLGDTPVARALAAVGREAGWEVRLATDPAAAVPADAGAVVVASHGGDEVPVLAAALRAGAGYVGLVASRRRGASVAAALELDDEQAARFHTPAGLDIGARTPGEIAVSIAAEIISVAAAAPPGPAAAAASGPGAAAERTHPVCGMTVAVAEATPRLRHGATTVYFCCPACRDSFAADPERYTAKL